MADHGRIMSPDTVSSLFPDRPIRPLPKRRLRERLSPEVADAIKYPPTVQPTVPLFNYPGYTAKDEASTASIATAVQSEQPRRVELATRNYTPRRNHIPSGAGGYREDTDLISRSTLVTRSPPDILNRALNRPSRQDHTRPAKPQPPPSTASSVDGYDSFENTNNKKKRKIPSAGDSTLAAGAHGLSADVSPHVGPTRAVSPTGDVNGERYHAASAYAAPGSLGSNGQGISGSGRGRLGRSRNGRSPLRSLPDGNNAWSGRSTKAGGSQWTSGEHEGPGIISSAIANAEKLPPQGQENVSLLQQHSVSMKSTPASTQFTFTCDSQASGNLQWPGHSSKQMAPQNLHAPTDDTGSKTASRESASSRRKTRRQTDRELNRAAYERRQLAADRFYDNPPKLEDIWMCEFCEYERIFGQPPRGLIRSYELKDRALRAAEADRKRLLDKAKARARKNKRNAKAPAKGGNPDTHSGQAQYDDGGIPPLQHGSGGSFTQSEDGDLCEYEAGYDDGYTGVNSTATARIEDEGGGGRPVISQPLKPPK